MFSLLLTLYCTTVLSIYSKWAINVNDDNGDTTSSNKETTAEGLLERRKYYSKNIQCTIFKGTGGVGLLSYRNYKLIFS